jgi:tetratricopeptide (TPR) repeat protein
LGLHSHVKVSIRDLTQANLLASQTLELARTLSNREVEAFGLWSIGIIAGHQSDYGRSIPLLEQSLLLYRELGDTFGQAQALRGLGAFVPDRERAKTHLMESLKLVRELEYLSVIGIVLKELANLEIWESEFLQSAQRLEEARSIFHQLGDHINEGSVLLGYGRLAFAQANYPLARAYYEESIALDEMSGDTFDSQWTRANMAYAALKEGDMAQARKLFELSIQGFQEINNAVGVVYAIEGLASLHCSQNHPQSAACLFGWADAMRAKIGDPRPPAEQADMDKDIAACLAKLGEVVFSDEYDAGKSMTLDAAVALALEEN